MKSHWDWSCISKLFWLSQCPACVLTTCKLSRPLKIINCCVCVNMFMGGSFTCFNNTCNALLISFYLQYLSHPPHLHDSEPKINSELMAFPPTYVFYRTRSTTSTLHRTCSLFSYIMFSVLVKIQNSSLIFFFIKQTNKNGFLACNNNHSNDIFTFYISSKQLE